MTWLRASVWVQFLLALYFQVVLWVPLGRFNAAQGEKLLDAVRRGAATRADLWYSLVMFLPAILFAAACRQRMYALMWLTLAGYAGWGLAQADRWWTPYLFGPSGTEVAPGPRTPVLSVLPSFPGHPAPDALHVILHLLLAAVIVSGAVGLVKARKEPPPAPKPVTAHSLRETEEL